MRDDCSWGEYLVAAALKGMLRSIAMYVWMPAPRSPWVTAATAAMHGAVATYIYTRIIINIYIVLPQRPCACPKKWDCGMRD